MECCTDVVKGRIPSGCPACTLPLTHWNTSSLFLQGRGPTGVGSMHADVAQCGELRACICSGFRSLHASNSHSERFTWRIMHRHWFNPAAQGNGQPRMLRVASLALQHVDRHWLVDLRTHSRACSITMGTRESESRPWLRA